MTKTAIKVRELGEQERHNKEMERQGRINTILSGISNVGSLLVPRVTFKGMLGKAKSLLSGDEFATFEKLQGLKDHGERLNNRDFKIYQSLLTKIKGGSK